MPKIKELIGFEEIKDVIDIDNDIGSEKDKSGIVQDYLISENLKQNIIAIADNVAKPKHKSVQIIGGYGSGKSHLLAWIVSLLENRNLVDDITDEDVKAKYKESLNRDFAVVQFELQPGASALSDFFFDRIEKQLKDKHDIEVPVRDTTKAVDYKKDIADILARIKEKDPTMGFAVVIDEISDFLKQKTKEQITRDMQFLRILGQVSQTLDFFFIGSMQENVFSSAKYVDEAESFGRVSERFEIVSISREDVKRVISRRVLKKDAEQRDQIDTLLSDYKKVFSTINSNPDSYIDLFPIHPYVIDIFSELPYFEKRGVIQFTMERVKEILDADFPRFITYENVFDEINAKHTIRNIDDVRPIIEIVDTLDTKIDLLDRDKQEDARRLVKALAVLRLYGHTANNGATPEELANELLITSKTVKSTDRIVLILDKLREVTSGQFIAKTENNYFYLSPEQNIDYDEVIKKKMRNLPDGVEDDELLRLIKYTDLIDAEYAESYVRTFLDTGSWPDKKSFRLGNFIFDDGSEQVKKGDRDFNLVIRSPYRSASKLSSSKQTAIVPIIYTEELDVTFKQLAATRLLINENYVRAVMQKKYNAGTEEAKALLLESLLNAELEIDGNKRSVKSVITKEPDTIAELFHDLKEDLFNDLFSSKYPKYPKFLNQMSHENIKGEVDTTLSDLTQKGEKNLFANAKNMLSSLDLIDLDGNIDTTSSLFARVILDELEKNKGKNVKVDELIEKLRSEPFGLNEELTQLLLAVLTYNGEINLRKRGGGTITSSDLPDIFKSGIDAFDDIPYATLETEFPIDAIVKLFRALNLNQGLVRNPKDRTKAVQEFRTKALDLSETLTSIERGMQEMSSKQDPIIRPEELSKTVAVLSEFPIVEFLAVKTVNDFKKVEYSDDEISTIKKNLDLIANIKGFIDDYNGFIHTEYSYLKKSLAWLDSYPSIFSDADKAPLNEIHAECQPLIHELSNILDSEQRRMLKGKLQQYKRKYIQLYYTKHTKTIGEGIDWDKLERINRSKELKRLRDIKAVRGVNPLNLNKLEERILALSKAQCTNLTEEHLKDSYRCSWCSFPETLKGIADINNEIDEIHKSVAVISNEWTKTILNEIGTYRDNIELLSDPEKAVIVEIGAERRLPDEMAQDSITALNNLFSELREVEISPREIVDFIFSDFSVLDYDAFSRKLEEYKEKILDRGEKRNIRIKRREV